jgi:hypothetical protein
VKVSVGRIEGGTNLFSLRDAKTRKMGGGCARATLPDLPTTARRISKPEQI